MQSGLLKKLKKIKLRLGDIETQLTNLAVINNQPLFQKLSKEVYHLRDIANIYDRYNENLSRIKSSTQMLEEESDQELIELAKEEIQQAQQENKELTQNIQHLLIPQDPADDSNIFIEIRAGTGGAEAALFAGDLMRMYLRYSEEIGWQHELVNSQFSDLNGYKEVVLRIVGHGAFSKLKFESGVHRVQRVPETESQGRIHTSTCTVAILPEQDTISQVAINNTDLKIDTYRASGAGGQHVNKTDSAIRITHIPSGIVVECQEERSQHKNRARAMSLLQAKILAKERIAQEEQKAKTRRSLIGSGARSERIRTYNFPQGRITDHRIGLTSYNLEMILQGKLQEIIEPLMREHQTDLLLAFQEEIE